MTSLYHHDITARDLANAIYAIQKALGLVLPQGTPLLHTFLHAKPVMGRVASGELPFGLGISPLEEIVVDFYGQVLGSQRRSSVECLKDWEPYKEDLPKLETLIMAFGDIDDYFKVNYFREDYHGLSILEKSARINCAETGLSDVFSNQPADVLAFLAFYRSGINVDHVTKSTIRYAMPSSEDMARLFYDALDLRNKVNETLRNYYPWHGDLADITRLSTLLPAWVFLVKDRDPSCDPYKIVSQYVCDLMPSQAAHLLYDNDLNKNAFSR